MEKTLYNKIDDIDLTLCNINTLQKLASRITFDVNQSDCLDEITNNKITELWSLIDMLVKETERTREGLQEVLKLVG